MDTAVVTFLKTCLCAVHPIVALDAKRMRPTFAQ